MIDEDQVVLKDTSQRLHWNKTQSMDKGLDPNFAIIGTADSGGGGIFRFIVHHNHPWN